MENPVFDEKLFLLFRFKHQNWRHLFEANKKKEQNQIEIVF